MVFVGPSGCGKSTLLRLISGLEDITSGDMLFDGQRVNDLAPSRRGIAMVFQSYALYLHMKVYDNMAFGMKLQKAGATTSRRGSRRRRSSCRSTTCSTACRSSSPAASASASPSAGRSSATRGCSCSTSRCRTSTPRCACHPARDRQAAPRYGQRDDGLRHPRPGRGDDPRRPHLRAARRRRHAGRARRPSSTRSRTRSSSPASSARRR